MKATQLINGMRIILFLYDRNIFAIVKANTDPKKPPAFGRLTAIEYSTSEPPRPGFSYYNYQYA